VINGLRSGQSNQQHPGELSRNPVHGAKVQNGDKVVSRELDAEQRPFCRFWSRRRIRFLVAAIFCIELLGRLSASGGISWLRTGGVCARPRKSIRITVADTKVENSVEI
jgi:hypothetical protein